MEKLSFPKIGGWIPKKYVMEFLGYKSSQMAIFMKRFDHVLQIRKIERRSFISESSLLEVLEDYGRE